MQTVHAYLKSKRWHYHQDNILLLQELLLHILGTGDQRIDLPSKDTCFLSDAEVTVSGIP
jgi:hypothetical protein